MQGRAFHHSWFVIALALQAAAPAWAWGRLGHRVISRLAEQHLSDKAKAGIKALLDKGESIADASTWADSYRSQHRETRPLALRGRSAGRTDLRFEVVGRRSQEGLRRRQDQRVPSGSQGQEQAGRGTAERASVPDPLRRGHAHADARRRQSRPGRQRHAGQVLRPGHEYALAVGWRVARANEQRGRLLAEGALGATVRLRAPTRATAGTVEDWATESLLAAREAYVDPLTGQRIKSGAKLGLDYHNKNIPVVKERMYLAGMRLAKVLNEAFDSH